MRSTLPSPHRMACSPQHRLCPPQRVFQTAHISALYRNVSGTAVASLGIDLELLHCSGPPHEPFGVPEKKPPRTTVSLEPASDGHQSSLVTIFKLVFMMKVRVVCNETWQAIFTVNIPNDHESVRLLLVRPQYLRHDTCHPRTFCGQERPDKHLMTCINRSPRMPG